MNKVVTHNAQNEGDIKDSVADPTENEKDEGQIIAMDSPYDDEEEINPGK